MSARRCHRHDLPIVNATVCPRCLLELEKALAEVPAVWDDLQVTISRQTAVGYREGGRAAEHPLPFNADAGENADALKATLVGWVRELHGDSDGHAGPTHHRCAHGSCVTLRDEQWPADTAASCSAWLLCRLELIRGHVAGDALCDEVTYAVAEARRAVDRPKNRSRVFVGACLDACAGELWAFFPLVDYDPDDDATHAKIACSLCPVAYPAMEWLRVGARVLRMREAS